MEVLYDDFRKKFPFTAIKKTELVAIAQKALTSKPFHIPDIYEICDEYPDIKKRYLAIYDKAMAGVKKQKDLDAVDEDTRIAQGMLMDGLVSAFPLNVNMKDLSDPSTVAILKRNTKEEADRMWLLTYYLPNGMTPSSATDQKNYGDVNKLVGKNKKGMLEGYSLNPQYTAGTEATSVVATGTKDKLTIENIVKKKNSLKAHHIGEKQGTYMMTPYLVIAMVIQMLRKVSEEMILRVTVQGYGAEKTRMVTGNPAILKDKVFNSDTLNIETSVDSFPMVGRIYIPIIGVPTLTVAKENIPVHLIQSIEPVNPKNYVPSEVERDATPQSEVKDIEVDSALYMLMKMTEAYYKRDRPSNADPELRAIMQELGISHSEVGGEYIAELQTSVARLHGARTFAERAKVTDGILGLKKLLQIKKNLYEPETYNPSCIRTLTEYDGDPETRKQIITDLLKKGVCRVQYITNDLRLMTVTCTLNDKALATAYGPDYYWKTASTKQKAGYLLKKVKEGQSVKDVLNHIYADGADDDNYVKGVQDILNGITTMDDRTVESICKLLDPKYTPHAKGEYQMVVKTLYSGIPGHIYGNTVQTLGYDKILKVIMMKEF